MKRFIYVVVLGIVMSACTTSEKEKEIENPPVQEEKVMVFDSTGVVVDSLVVTEPKKPVSVTLSCRQISSDSADDPLFEVSLSLLNRNIVLDTVHVCRQFNVSDFDEIEIPSSAVSACGGWYKGVGEYFYLSEENSDLVVNYAWLREEQTTNRYPYREIYRLKLPEIEQ